MIKIAILNQLRNTQNVINICNYKIEKNKISVIIPLMNGDLKSLIKNNTFNINNIPKYFKQIVLGLHACHYNDIIHRDIKPDNILYDATNDEFKLIDFGISLTYSSIPVYVDPEMAATFNYRAPEALLRSEHYNKKLIYGH
jgi:serine/threonine protein kinase